MFQIKVLLAACQKTAKLDCIDRGRVKLLIKFLKPFHEESTKLEGENYPTLPLVVLSASLLKEHCEFPLMASPGPTDEGR